MEELDFYPSSPVPADRWLFGGELPFTAFGQHGKDALDLRVFEQDVWWVDRYGQEHLLTEMDTDYLRAVKFHMLRYSKNHHEGAKRRYSIELALIESTMTKNSLVDYEGYRTHVLTKRDPRLVESFEWLEGTPLYKRIGELLEARAQ